MKKFIIVYIAFFALGLLALMPHSTQAAAALTATSTTIASNNASTTLAKVGNTVSFYVGLSGTPWAQGTTTINIFGMGSTSMVSSTGAPSPYWTYSTTSASSWTEGPISFYVSFGNTDGTATTTISQSNLSSRNVRFDKTAPTGYTVSMDSYVNNSASTSAAFTFASGEAYGTYLYYLGNGSATTTSSGTLSTASDSITGIDLHSITDGTLTLYVALTDAAGNKGATTTASTVKDTSAPSDPTATPSEGSYSTRQDVELASSGSDSIRYTVDGTTPACPSTGTAYSSAIAISKSKVLTAVGCDAAGNSSAAVPFTYEIRGGGNNSAGGGGGSSSRPATSVTQTTTNTEEKTKSALEAQIKQLLAQLEVLKAGMPMMSVPMSPAKSVAGVPVQPLEIGAMGDEVTKLQQFLIDHGQTIPAGATGKFGGQTQAALMMWQKMNGLPASGFYGPKTEAMISQMMGN